MGRIAVTALLAVFVFGSVASAQDDEGEDIDSLMATDPEPAPKADDEEEAADEPEEKPEGISDDAMQNADDERPPGDEPSVDSTPKETAPEDEGEGGHPYPVSLGVLAGYGISTDDAGNAWSFGFGARGGYNLGGLFLGGRFVYYLGETFEVPTGSVLGRLEVEEETISLWEFGFEAGYDIDLGSVALRPGLGLGFASVSAGTQTEANLFVAPGMTLFYEVSDTVFLGLDARYQAVLATETVSGIVLLANVGMRL